MSHAYEAIPGWWSEQDCVFYQRMVAEAACPAVFVEVGCWLGKSTASMAGAILASGKDISLHVYDTFGGSENEPSLIEQAKTSDLMEMFLQNMWNLGFGFEAVAPDGLCRDDRRFHVRRIESVKAARLHQDKSLRFVFIDACHVYEAVKADIQAWLPKVAKGGIIAGHDWNVYAGVRQAVAEVFGSHVQSDGNCWFVPV